MKNPEEEYLTDLKVVLKKIKSGLLHTASNRTLKYRLSHLISSDWPSDDEERELIYQLAEEGIIEVLHENRHFFEISVNKDVLEEKYSKINYPPKKAVQEKPVETPDNYDVVFSLAGEQKEKGQRVKDKLASKGIVCWIYTEREAELAGSDQPTYLQNLFMNETDFCVIIISNEYVRKTWTGLEREYIIAKRMEKKDYIIPLQYNDCELPGLPKTVGYIPWHDRSEDEIANIILNVINHRRGIKRKISYIEEPDFPLPKLKKVIDPYEEKDKWIEYTINELTRRISKVPGMKLHLADLNQIRISFNGNTIYSLNIYKNFMGSEKGISFFGSYGELTASANNAINAWGQFEWSKEKEEAVLNMTNASLFALIGEKKQYTKTEFVNDLWKMIVDYLDRNY